MIANWLNLNRCGFRLVENLISRMQYIKDRVNQGYVTEVFHSNSNAYFSTTCCTSKLVSNYPLQLSFFLHDQ